MEPLGGGLSQTGTDGMGHETLLLVGRLFLGSSHDGKEGQRTWLLLVEKVGEAVIMSDGLTLAAQHRQQRAVGKDDIIVMAGSSLHLHQYLETQTVGGDGICQSPFSFLKRLGSLGID